jgi:hypothetical protein
MVARYKGYVVVVSKYIYSFCQEQVVVTGYVAGMCQGYIYSEQVWTNYGKFASHIMEN